MLCYITAPSSQLCAYRLVGCSAESHRLPPDYGEIPYPCRSARKEMITRLSSAISQNAKHAPPPLICLRAISSPKWTVAAAIFSPYSACDRKDCSFYCGSGRSRSSISSALLSFCKRGEILAKINKTQEIDIEVWLLVFGDLVGVCAPRRFAPIFGGRAFRAIPPTDGDGLVYFMFTPITFPVVDAVVSPAHSSPRYTGFLAPPQPPPPTHFKFGEKSTI